MNKYLEGKIALVTGATLGLGKVGATVYITGRTLESNDNSGSLGKTESAVTAAGGICIPIQVDHNDDETGTFRTNRWRF